VEKSDRDSDATNDNMANAYCMLNNWGYSNKLRICNFLDFPLQQWLNLQVAMSHI